MGNKIHTSRGILLGTPRLRVLPLGAGIGLTGTLTAPSAEVRDKQNTPIPVRFSDIWQAAGITFRQNSTQTEEKYYLKTMGTGVA